jgi:signal transduction histidine kinase
MCASRDGCRPRAAVALAAMFAGSALSGCSDGPAGLGAWGFVSLALLAVCAGAYLVGATRSRAESVAALQKSRTDALALHQLASGWIWETDAGHRILSWQGRGRPALDRCALFGDATPAVAPAARELGERLRSQQPFSDLRVTLPQPQDGSWAWSVSGVPRYDVEGRFSGYIGSAIPLDEDEAMRAAAAAFPTLFEALPGAAVWALAAPQGWRVGRLNSAARARWPEAIGGSALASVSAELPEPVRGALTTSGDGQIEAIEAEGWRVDPLPAASTGTRSLLLTQRVDFEPAAKVAAAESDNLAFTVTHDLRAPIRVVEGFTRIVKEDYGRLLDRVGNDHLDRVLGATARMNLMIDALMALARLSSQPLARQPVNLSQLAAYVVDDLRRGAPDRDVDVVIEPGLTAQGDPTLLRLVLENLLANAWKYTARCQRAVISFRSIELQGRSAWVVRDNGAGFDMRSADRLFGLFQRLHSASEFPGHGVGLASVRRIVHRHGGEVWAESEPGRGASFYFTLGG